MIIVFADDKLRSAYTEITAENEVGGDISLAYRFSLAKSGKSGYSFGITQIDVNNNPWAMLALRDLEFTTQEVAALKTRAIKDLTPFNAKLASHKDVVSRWDMRQIDECLTWPMHLCEDRVNWYDRKAFLGVADYHNQLNFSRGGRLYNYIFSQVRPITLEMIRDFKLTLDWGIDNPEDVERRYETIIRLAR